MGYDIGLGLQNPEMKILFQADIRLLRNYGGDTWYMGIINEELQNYTCVWLISIWGLIKDSNYANANGN